MKGRVTIVVVTVALAWQSFAQTPIERAMVFQPGQKIEMHFDYPQVVLSTWDRNEVAITGTVSINNGENDDAFILETESEGSTIIIRSKIKDLKKLSQRITVIHKGQKMIFCDKAAFEKYRSEHGKAYEMMSTGPDMEIVLEIKVPHHTPTKVDAVYGMVEVRNFDGPLQVESTYGGVDAALAEGSTGEIVAETNYGEIYSNLNARFSGSQEDRAFHTLVTARPGEGPHYSFVSKYGNVYLRKRE